MKANELRVNNYVFSKETQSYQKITGITEENIYIDTITFDYPDYDEIEPIELTEEILLKCGFKVSIDIYYLLKMNGYFKKPFKEADHFLYKSNSGDTVSSVKHLHQLQNLIHAITGEELEINL